MSKISSMLDVGKRSMMNSQTALQVVGHNIANKSTEGYSRQRVEIQSNEPVGSGNLRIGMGSKAVKVTRVNNPFMEKQLSSEESVMGFHNGRAGCMSHAEQIFNEQFNPAFNRFLSDFFNSFQELSNNPESMVTRTMVKESAQYLCQDFHRINKQLKDVQANVDQEIITSVNEINQITAEVAHLNKKIQEVEISGVTPNDERDKRDLLLKKLSHKMDINFSEGEWGKVLVTSPGGGILVSGYESNELVVGRDSKYDGHMGVYLKNSENNNANAMDITKQIRSGSLGGILEVRDEIVVDLLNRFDKMAYNLASEVNKAHIEGYNRYNQKGLDFFQVTEGIKDASEKIKINEEIFYDVGKIAASLKPNSPSDNTVARVISNIKYKEIMEESSGTLDEFYNSMVGQVGITTQRSYRAVELQKNIMEQLKNLRESISGVNLDEEMTKMIEFQKNFDASAKLIKTTEELFDTILSLKS